MDTARRLGRTRQHRPLPRLVRLRRLLVELPVVLLVLTCGADDPASAAASAAATSTSSAPAVPWSWPVAPPHPVVRAFTAPEHPWSPGHRGIDVGTSTGSSVTAPSDGVVHFSGVVVDRPVLSLRHADGVLSSLEPVISELSAGDPVHRGQVVGTVQAGHCPDVECVHLGARIDGEYVSPLMMLGLGRPSVLLPTRRPG
ncbi:M23 family metallopeptidase [Frigoribacterium sp. ACAM 257]|uniref:M23 family metallopeptidase n=1 Tax=Frigoribacterium sp. ACAM 257 TaxID=2508998 RepID=UPI0011B965E6|nr:M23 family metallopeptidase [Frigoribacterium sp. ACAM 257]TWX40383.1 M23 family metallopeptidase [Frigoribacterium sp. ACAM 257]